jgi:TolB-like protein
MEKYHLDLVINKNMKYMYAVFVQMLNTSNWLSDSMTVNSKKNEMIPTMWRTNTLFVISRFTSQLTMLDKKPNNSHRYSPAMAVRMSMSWVDID